MKNIIVALLGLTLTSSCLAAEKTKYINANAGVAVEMASGSESAFTFGGRFGADAFEFETMNLALGIDLSKTGKEYKTGTIVADANITWLTGEVVARKAWDTGLFFGGRIGAGFTYIDISSGSVSLAGTGTSFAWGPVVGYELPLAEKLNFTAELSWMNLGSGEIDLVTRQVPYEGTSYLIFRAGVLFDWP